MFFEGYVPPVINLNRTWGAPPSKKFQFVAGDLALDFTNTMGGKRGAIARENLHTYTDFLSWSWQAGLVDETSAKELSVEAAQCPQDAASVLTRAIKLRETIYRIFAAVVRHRAVAPEDIDLLNRELRSGLNRLCVRGRSKSEFEWTWTKQPCSMDQSLGPVARAAADLMVSPAQLSKVHHCSGDNCGWLFIDCSKNHSRRWCDMRDCGNRAKVRRHRLKQRKGGQNVRAMFTKKSKGEDAASL